MEAKMELERAEQRVRVAKAHLAEVTGEHAKAAAEARVLEADARRVDPDNAGLYARRTRDLTVALAECSRCEGLIAQAQSELDAAEAALRKPQAAVWASEVAALETSAREVAIAAGSVISGLAALFSGRGSLRSAMQKSTARQQRLSQLAKDMAGHSSADASSDVALLLRRAQTLLWTIEKLRPESIADPEYAAALVHEMRTHLELPEYKGAEPYAPVAQLADIVSGKYVARTRSASMQSDEA
jgi:hypothetical protein